jgi:hypothetical protein
MLEVPTLVTKEILKVKMPARKDKRYLKSSEIK